MAQDSTEILARLTEQHRFPGPFLFKAIGPNRAEFVAAILGTACAVLGPNPAPEVSTRDSAAGRHTAVTLTAQVERPEQVLEIWALMAKVDGVKMVM